MKTLLGDWIYSLDEAIMTFRESWLENQAGFKNMTKGWKSLLIAVEYFWLQQEALRSRSRIGIFPNVLFDVEHISFLNFYLTRTLICLLTSFHGVC